MMSRCDRPPTPGQVGAVITAVLALMAGCAAPTAPVAGSAPPGWTGRTQVIGNNSSVAGNDDATYLQQKWGVGQRR
jgi:hypothetical protein